MAKPETQPTYRTGKICYIEIPARDIDRSAEFYRRAFGWHIRKRGDGSTAFDDTVNEVSGTWVLGRPMPAEPGLMVYIMVASAAAASKAVVSVGGVIVKPVDPNAREVVATFRDPAGNLIGIYQQPGLAEAEAGEADYQSEPAPPYAGPSYRLSKEVAMAEAPTTGKKAAVHNKSLDSPDETRTFGKGKMEAVNVGGVSVIRLHYEAGWKWSEHVKPIAKTDRCEAQHVGYMMQGRLHIVGRDGSEGEINAGDGFVIPPGHDAWTVGNETVILLDLKGSPAPS